MEPPGIPRMGIRQLYSLVDTDSCVRRTMISHNGVLIVTISVPVLVRNDHVIHRGVKIRDNFSEAGVREVIETKIREVFDAILETGAVDPQAVDDKGIIDIGEGNKCAVLATGLVYDLVSCREAAAAIEAGLPVARDRMIFGMVCILEHMSTDPVLLRSLIARGYPVHEEKLTLSMMGTHTLPILLEAGLQLTYDDPDVIAALSTASSSRTARLLLKAYGSNIHRLVHDNTTPLSLAIRQRSPRDVAYLLTSGFSPESTAGHGITAVQLACMQTSFGDMAASYVFTEVLARSSSSSLHSTVTVTLPDEAVAVEATLTDLCLAHAAHNDRQQDVYSVEELLKRGVRLTHVGRGCLQEKTAEMLYRGSYVGPDDIRPFPKLWTPYLKGYRAGMRVLMALLARKPLGILTPRTDNGDDASTFRNFTALSTMSRLPAGLLEYTLDFSC